jgi:hypothetical protein
MDRPDRHRYHRHSRREAGTNVVYYPDMKTEWDAKAVWSMLREYLVELAQEHPEVEQVILFGPFAQDRSLPPSRLQLLLTLSDSDLELSERIERYRPANFPATLELFPYTRQEIAEMRERSIPWLETALREGVLMAPLP